MDTHQGLAQRLPVPSRAWRRVLDAPVAAAVATVVVAVLVTADRSAPGTASSVLAGTGGGALLVGSLLVGLPHGAVDLLRPEVLAPGATSRSRRLVTAAYLGCAAAAVACWLALPLPTLLALLVLAAVHFGAADDVTARWRARGERAGSPPSTVLRVLRALAAGALPVAVPLGLHGQAVHGVLEGLSGSHADLVVACARVGSVVALVAAAGTCALALAGRRWSTAAETAALAALFALVTPLLAFAVYFGLWHSWRQVARMVAADAVRDRTGPWRALGRFARCAAVPTAVTVVAAAAAVLAAGSSVLVVGLALVLCLTVPHSVVVARSDRSLRWARTDRERPATSTPTSARPLPLTGGR